MRKPLPQKRSTPPEEAKYCLFQWEDSQISFLCNDYSDLYDEYPTCENFEFRERNLAAKKKSKKWEIDFQDPKERMMTAALLRFKI